jgi:hypothetical protein
VTDIVQWAHRDLRPFVRAALGAGWRVQHSGDSHLKWLSPDGESIVHSSGKTLTSRRTLENIRQQLMHAGLKLGYDNHAEERPVTETTPPATTNLGDVLKQAQAPPTAPAQPEKSNGHARVIDDRDTRTVVEELMGREPERVWKSEDVVAGVLRVKDVSAAAVYLAIKNAMLSGRVHKFGRGSYQWRSTSGRATARLEPAPLPAGARTGDEATDRDLEELDEALAALARIEAMIRKHRKAVTQLAELKRTLAGIAL